MGPYLIVFKDKDSGQLLVKNLGWEDLNALIAEKELEDDDFCVIQGYLMKNFGKPLRDVAKAG